MPQVHRAAREWHHLTHQRQQVRCQSRHRTCLIIPDPGAYRLASAAIADAADGAHCQHNNALSSAGHNRPWTATIRATANLQIINWRNAELNYRNALSDAVTANGDGVPD